MNILILTTSYPADADDPSGRFIHELARGLARRGHALRVVVPWRCGPAGWHDLDGVRVHHFRYARSDAGHRLTATPGGIPEALRRRPLDVLRVPLLLGHFAGAARREAAWADVLWANWLGAGMVGTVARRSGRTPIVITLRGDDAYLVRDRRLWRTVGRRVFAASAAITAVSRNMVEAVEPLVPRAKRPVIVPTFGVDPERFSPAAEAKQNAVPVADDGPRGLFVGNVSRAKGMDVLLRALATCPAARGTMRIVGGGPDVEAMQRLAGDLGIAGRLEWSGPQPAAAVPELMRAADYLVLPSLSEGRPNVVIEAMACALPVIATDVGGTADLVDDGRTGLLVAPGDADGLGAAIAQLCGDATRRRDMGRAGRQKIIDEDLTWDRTAREFEAIFQRVCRGT